MDETINEKILNYLIQNWRRWSGLVIILCLVNIFIGYLILTIEDLRIKDLNSNHLIYFLIGSFFTIIFWVFIKYRNAFINDDEILKVGLTITIEEKFISKANDIVYPVIRQLSNDPNLKHIKIIRLPDNIFHSNDEANKYLNKNDHELNNFLWLLIVVGKENGKDKLKIKQGTFFRNLETTKLIIEDVEIDLNKEINFRSSGAKWGYYESDDIKGKDDLQNSLKDNIIYYFGIVLILKGKYKESLSSLKLLYKSQDSLVEGNTNDEGKLQVILKRENFLSARLEQILCKIYRIIASHYYDLKQFDKVVNCLQECEQEIGMIAPMLPNFVLLARAEYDRGNIDSAKSYTNKMKSVGGYNQYVAFNLAFFSIIEDNIKEVVRNYKYIVNNTGNSNPKDTFDVIEFLNEQSLKFANKRPLFDYAIGALNITFGEKEEGHVSLVMLLKTLPEDTKWKVVKNHIKDLLRQYDKLNKKKQKQDRQSGKE